MEFKARSTEEKIAFLHSRKKTVIISAVVWSAVMAIAGVLLWCLLSLWQVAVALFVCIPLYIYFVGYMKVKQFKKEIAELTELLEKKEKR